MEKHKIQELISVIVLNHNGIIFLDKCLSSILSQKYSNIEVIFVDNASTDGSVNFVKSKYPEVKIVINKIGLGFGGGNLSGVKAAKGKKILLVSNDTWMEPQLITNLNRFFDLHEFNVIAPYQADYEGKTYSPNTSLVDPLGHHIYVNAPKIEPFYLTGVCLFCEKDFYLKTRGMDPKFFMYIEDADWFWRLQLFGFTFAYVPDTSIYHKGGGSSGGHDTKILKSDIFMYRNRNTIFMLLKNYSLLGLLIVLPLYVTVSIVEILFFILLFKFHIVEAYIKSWIQVCKNLDEILADRRWIQKKRIKSDIQIFAKMYHKPAKLMHLLGFYFQ